MNEPRQLTGGELKAAITSALAGIHTEYLGRGPARAAECHPGNSPVTLTHGVLTNAEKSLAKTDRAPVVKNTRQLLHQTLEADSRAAVDRLTGREVVAFISGNHLDPDIAADLFILNPPFDSN